MIKFTKMQGCGNDYIYINQIQEKIKNIKELSIEMSKRHFSVGSDGIITIDSSNICDFKMRIFNADGSEGNMCGNGIRCVGKYVYENRLTDKTHLTIETKSGVKTLDLHVLDNGLVDFVSVDMGKAMFNPESIPAYSKEPIIDKEIEVLAKKYKSTAVSMGNPHQVIFMNKIDDLDLVSIGPSFENYPLFPERVNTEFVEILGENHFKMRVYERGSAETYACGTGACAVASVACKLGMASFNKKIRVDLIGGTLYITVKSDWTIIMEGPAKKIYDGVYYED